MVVRKPKRLAPAKPAGKRRRVAPSAPDLPDLPDASSLTGSLEDLTASWRKLKKSSNELGSRGANRVSPADEIRRMSGLPMRNAGRLPSAAELFGTPKPTGGSAWERELFGEKDATKKGTSSFEKLTLTESDQETTINPNGRTVVNDFVWVYGSNSSNPARPRTLDLGYSSSQKIVRIRFRDGAGYEYYGVPQNVWRNLRRVGSPGRFINRTLNGFQYARVDF